MFCGGVIFRAGVYSYVVVAVKQGVSKELTSWVLDADGKAFLPEEIREEN